MDKGDKYILTPGRDWLTPLYDPLQRWVMRRFEEASDNVNGLLPEMFRQASFDHVEETTRYATLFGTLSLYRARKPG